MKGYKSSETRLVYLFKDGREKWKERALSKQKKLRATELTPDKVLQAMESLQSADVTAPSKEVFGQSMLSKRKVAFSTEGNYTKVA